MNRIGRIGQLALLAVGMLVWTSPAHAFRMIQNTNTGRVTAGNAVACNDAGGFAHWTTGNVTWYLNTANQGSGKWTAVQTAMQSWTNVPSASYRLKYGGTTSAGFVTDGVNALVWENSGACTGSCLALTALVLQSGQVIVESDVTFNNAYTWQTSGSDTDTEAVTAHEFGHALGIHHTDVATTPYPTMRATYFGSGARSLETDDRSALQCSQSTYPVRCTNLLSGEGFTFAGKRWGDLSWDRDCIATANADVFRDGVRITTTANDGQHMDSFVSGATSANYWVCDAGSTTWYDSNYCSNVITVYF